MITLKYRNYAPHEVAQMRNLLNANTDLLCANICDLASHDCRNCFMRHLCADLHAALAYTEAYMLSADTN